MMNKVLLVGYLGKDPEKNVTTTGKTVVRFSLPLYNPYASKKDLPTEWMQCEVWNQSAEYLVNYGRKGDLVVAEGHLRNQRYENTEGETRYRTYVAIDRLSVRNIAKNNNGNNNNNYNNSNNNSNSSNSSNSNNNNNNNNNESTTEIGNNNFSNNNESSNMEDLFKEFDI